ncbi:hypothetical protein F8N00_09030 [Exiguobacterium sp. A1_3_1]|uniref:hypothetical protein n=1 Tax=Exiguobacterium sp. A1_3_1 TaxID=2651871 RepID=UPI003B889703
MSTISEMDIMHEFFSDNDQIRYDDEPHRIYADLHDKDSAGNEIVIKSVPRFTYIEGDLGDSFIPYDVERVLVKFLKAFKNGSILYSSGEKDEIVFNYSEVEAYSVGNQ